MHRRLRRHRPVLRRRGVDSVRDDNNTLGWEHALQGGAQVFGQDDASICATDRRPEHGTDGARSRGVEVRECASVEMNDRRDASSPCDGEERDVADERGELLRYWDVYRRYVTAETLAGRGEDMPSRE